MSKPSINYLEVTAPEKKKLRTAGIKVKEIHLHSVKDLQSLLSISKIRAMELFALSEFQSLPSIGIRFAHDLISLGYYSLKELKGKSGAKLTDRFELQMGAWIDPCVEDQFRLVVHYANSLSPRNWWDFTAERKLFRAKNGYPASRPKKAWFELPQYTSARIPATHEATQKDLEKKLRLAIQFMKKNFEDTITLKQLADISHLSSYHFIRCFKSAFERTPFQYLTHLRLKKACHLLRRTTYPVSDIVSLCGFENESSFIRLFKRELRQTPLAYRNHRVDLVAA